MKIERKYKESWSKWEPVSEEYAMMILKDTFYDVALALALMKDGQEVQTMFAYYRIAPDDQPSDVKHLIQHLKTAGDEETAKLLQEYIARGLIRNLDRKGEDHG